MDSIILAICEVAFETPSESLIQSASSPSNHIVKVMTGLTAVDNFFDNKICASSIDFFDDPSPNGLVEFDYIP